MKREKAVERNFSRYAHAYDRYAEIQNIAANELIDYLPSGAVNKIFEIGCGTGNYTRMLQEKFPKAKITAIDISPKMIEVAVEKASSLNTTFITSNAETITLNDTFDIITANAAIHWLENIVVAVEKYKNLLTENGIFAFSFFGPETFSELGKALEDTLGGKATITAGNFLEPEKLRMVMEESFSGITTKEMMARKDYPSLLALLNNIKYTGTRGKGLDLGKPWNKGLLQRIEAAYLKRYGKIRATYQISFYKAIK